MEYKLDGDYMCNTKVDKAISIRVPPGVFDDVVALSKRELRSVNATIVLMLQCALKKTTIDRVDQKLEKLLRRLDKMQGAATPNGLESTETKHQEALS